MKPVWGHIHRLSHAPGLTLTLRAIRAAPATNRRATEFPGLTCTAGVDAGWSRCAAQGSGGFTICRPDPRSLQGTAIGYGDVLGAQLKFLACRVDGIDDTLSQSLPYPTENTGLQGDLTIIGLSLPPRSATPPARAARPVSLAPPMPATRQKNPTVRSPLKPSATSRAATAASPNSGADAALHAGLCEWVAGPIAGTIPTADRHCPIHLGPNIPAGGPARQR